MRPIRLELSGFTSFKEHCEVDFSDVRCFAFTGRTGAGKSSLIDAMTFALYGRIPRHSASARPLSVITQGEREASVTFDFSVNGIEYRATRKMVRPSPNGGVTEHARFEQQGRILADDAQGVSEEVERLLRLRMQDFTRCVVLSQDAFAQLLHDEPEERHDLLTRVLNLTIYDEIAARASHLASDARTRSQLLAGELETLANVSDDNYEQALNKVRELVELEARIRVDRERIEVLDATVSAAQTRLENAEHRLGVFIHVHLPANVHEVMDQLAWCLKSHDSAVDDENHARLLLDEARTTLRSLPERSQLKAQIEAIKSRDSLVRRCDRAQAELEHLKELKAKITNELDAAEEAQHLAASALEASRNKDTSDYLAGTLLVGKPCPVCHHVVTNIPTHIRSESVTGAERNLAMAERNVARLRERVEHSLEKVLNAEFNLNLKQSELRIVDRQMSGHNSLSGIQTILGQIDHCEQRLSDAQRALDAATERHHLAEMDYEAAKESAAEARLHFDLARDELAQFGTPRASRTNLRADAEELAEWLERKTEEATAEKLEADRTVTETLDEIDRIAEGLIDACARAEVAITDPGRPLDDCVQALANERAALERIKEDRAHASRLRVALDGAAREFEVAEPLAEHLRSRAFKDWLLTEALDQLVSRAGRVLRELSQSQYSLACEPHGGFTVIDHLCADERRPARTLSGGETFLASLALALALIEDFEDVSGGGPIQLESLFIDEGFGALDPDTIDTVASAIEVLASGDRVVGLVTHVRELAERMPVRFEVQKGPKTSTVEKIIA